MKHNVARTWALLWAITWLFIVPSLYADSPKEILVALGMSRHVSVPFAIATIEPAESSHVFVRQIMDGDGEVKRLMLVALRPGNELLTVRSKDKTRTETFAVRIPPLIDDEALKAQIAAEREEGIEVRTLVLKTPTLKVKLPRSIGPIFLTVPAYVDFQRDPAAPATLTFGAMADGQTDMWIYDEENKLMVKYFFRVRTKSFAKPFPPPLPLPAGKKGRVRFFDHRAKERRPVY